MATETLKIDITADNKDAVGKLKSLENNLVNFEKALKKSTDTNQILYLQRNIDLLKGKISDLSKETSQKLVNGSNQAANALTNLGRVAQDAPYGFIGIQNNLNPLLESFQRLQAETGSVSGAFKSIASSLIGPAGIGLALSVGGALLVEFGDKLFSVSEESKRAAESQKKYNEELSKSTGKAQEEITELQILVGIVNNHTESIDTRKRALTQLKEKYNGNIELQKIDIEDSKKLIELTNKLSDAIIRKAKADAFAGLIAEEEAKKAKLQNQTSGEMIDKVGTMNKAWNKLMGLAQGLATGNQNFYTSLEDSKDALKIQNSELSQVQKNLNLYNDLLKKNTEEQIRNNDAATNSNTIASQEVKSTSAKNTAAKESTQLFKPINTREQATVSTQMASLIDPTTIRLKNSEQLNQVLAQQAQLQDENNKKLQQANQFANLLFPTISNVFSAVESGKNAFDAIGDSLKNLAISLAETAVKAGILAAIMSLIPGAGGVNLAANAGGFSGIFKGLLGFASGGTVTGPQSGYPVMLHGTESIVRPDQMNKIIAGSAKMGQNMSEMQQPNMGGQFVLRGSDLVLATQRANYSLNLRRG